MSEILVKYGEHQPVAPGASCGVCGAQAARLITEHCHEHGWVRGVACGRCNTYMSLIDRGIKPQTELIDALIALAAQCPDCPPVVVADLIPTALGRPFNPASGEVNSDEMRRNFRPLLSFVERGGAHIIIKRYDEPAAMLVPKDWYEKAKAALETREEQQ